MQTNHTSRRAKAFLATMSLALILTQTCLSATGSTTINPGDDEPARKTKTHSAHSLPSIKIYPDMMRKTMHVIARRNNDRPIDFFVFDMEGTLMQNYKMKARDHMKIVGLKKGSYVYRVFCGDEETAAGNFEIR